LVFLLMQLVPGDPIVNFLGANATEEQIAHYTELFGYDQPVLVQYGKWIIGLFHGEMGRSVSLQREISEVIFQRLGVTLTIVIPAFLLAVILGVVLGIIAAKKRGSKIDTVISFFANIGMSMPMFWFGMLLIMLFALKLGILPTSGLADASDGTWAYVSHFILPVIVLAMGPLAQFTRQTRSSMLEVIRQDYVTTARAKGVTKRDLTFKHQLRNALIPIITVMGVQLGGMIGGTVLVESIFVIPGLGNLMITAIKGRDFMVVENGVLIIAIAVAICNLVVDILYGIIDPRIRND
ncbi:MAG TPA: ABC transporter permease, partial [Candidatus Blautia faecavium]|nr:ABC transporter permease [Candidatus Blautia faecavium]